MTHQRPPAPAQDLARRTLILGGARSGKSHHAEQLLAGYDRVHYVAPGPIPDDTDPDWAARVAAHRRRRPPAWITHETSDVTGVLREAHAPVLVDCLTTWLAAVMDRAGAWTADATDTWQDRVEAEVERLLRAWDETAVPVVAVSNEVGCGVVPSTRSGGLFRDAMGGLNRRLADHTEDLRYLVAGRALRL